VSYQYRISMERDESRWICIYYDNWMDDINGFVSLVKTIQDDCSGIIMKEGIDRYIIIGSELPLVYQYDGLFGMVVEYPFGCEKEKAIEFIKRYISPNTEDEDYSNNSLYQWSKDVMSGSDITSFSLIFGKCPVVNMRFEDNKIISYNRIHSRDSWKTFPKDFFAEKVVVLSQKEIKKIHSYLDTIKFERWKTDSHVLKNYIEGATGFSVDKTFCCEFNNNTIFRCFNPKGIKYRMLVRYLKKLCKRR